MQGTQLTIKTNKTIRQTIKIMKKAKTTKKEKRSLVRNSLPKPLTFQEANNTKQGT